MALNVAVFAWMLLRGVDPWEPSGRDVLAFGANNGPLVAIGQWWRLYTSTFVHGGAIHLAVNMWALYVLGPPIERMFGPRAFFLIYTFSGLGGSIASTLRNPSVVGVGASGAIFGLPGALAAFFLAHRSNIPAGLFRGQMQRLATFIGVNVVIGLSIPAIDLAAHGGGLVTGFVCGFAAYRDAVSSASLSKARFVRLLLIGAVLVALVPLIRWRVSTDRKAGPLFWVDRGYHSMVDEDWAGVRKAAEHALALDAENPGAFDLRARAAFHDHNADDALRDLDRALQLNPAQSDSRALRAWVRQENGDIAGALKDLDALIAEGDASGSVQQLRADLRYRQGRFADAWRDFETAASLDPRIAADSYLFAWLSRVRAGARDEATRDLTKRFEAGAFGSGWEHAAAELVLGRIDDAAFENVIRSIPNPHTVERARSFAAQLAAVESSKR